jgi:hypothetical protein
LVSLARKGIRKPHDTVSHRAEEYVRRQKTVMDGEAPEERVITTNTVEGFYSIFKRGMRGT